MGKLAGVFGYSSGNQQDNNTSQGTSLTSLIFDPASKQFLDSSLTDTTYDKSAAVNDATSASNFAVRQILQNEMPGISSAAASAGGYNSTTKQLLTDDLAARASAAGANVVLQNIKDYAAIKAGNVNAGANVVRTTTGSKVATTNAQQSNQQKQSTDLKGGTVICTQLYRDGHISRAVYAADGKYSLTNFSATTIRGYQFWAVPFVCLMRSNKVAYAVGKFLGVHWSNKCAGKTDWLGSVFHYTLRPLCYLLGLVVPDTDYTVLYSAER